MGKTSLFQPILGIVHHSNIATITTQGVFNKAMINCFTEVIFIDEASTSTVQIEDWKIFTQCGYIAADIKYQTAIFVYKLVPDADYSTAKIAIQLQIPTSHICMDRRLQNYTFKSLRQPKKKAAEWLWKNPMHCMVWEAEKVHKAYQHNSSKMEGSEEEDQAVHFDGSLPELEKEALRRLQLASTRVKHPWEKTQETALLMKNRMMKIISESLVMSLLNTAK